MNWYLREEHFDDVVAKEVVEDVIGGEGDDKHGTTMPITKYHSLEHPELPDISCNSIV